MANIFTAAKRTILGKDALTDSEKYLTTLGKKAFIVSGKIVKKTGLVDKVTELLDKNGIAYFVFTEITGEPTDVMIDAGAKCYTEENCDFAIGIGGGSPLDSAKAVLTKVTLGGAMSDYMGKEICGAFPPLVLIPTTAGTGSEATKFFCVTDTKTDTKMLLRSDDLIPDLAIVDPSLTVSSPKSITAATGMDALTHAVEAYTSRKANSITDHYAISAIKRIFTYLPQAYADGTNLVAREQMAFAAYEAGVCINNSSVTLVHGMSRPIGALFHVPHGISNAMIITECLKFALEGNLSKFGTLAVEIGAADVTDSDAVAADKFIGALQDICSKCEIPFIAEYGIKKEEFMAMADKMAGDAVASGSPSNTVKEVTKEDILTIYAKLWE